MAFNRFPGPGPGMPGPGMPGPGPGPGVNFQMNAPYYMVPPTFPIMGGPPVNPGWHGNPMMSIRPNMVNPNVPIQPKDMGYWRGSDRVSPSRNHNTDSQGPQDRRPEREFARRGSPPRQSESFDYHHAGRDESSDIRHVRIVTSEKRYSPDRDRGERRGREDSRERIDDGPSGNKRMRYDDSPNQDRYGREDHSNREKEEPDKHGNNQFGVDGLNRYDERDRRDRDRDRDRGRDRDRSDDFLRSQELHREREDERRYDEMSRRSGSDMLRYDSHGQSVRHADDMFQDRGGSRRSPSPRREERNGYRRSPDRRSLESRSPGRRSPGRRSPSWSSQERSGRRSPWRSPGRRSPERSPGRRSPSRRSPGRRSPSRRSPGRSPSRRSPRHRSPDWRSSNHSPPRRSTDRGSPGHGYWREGSRHSPDSRHRDGNLYRRSPDRGGRDDKDSYRRSPDRGGRDDKDSYRRSPDRYGREEPDRSRHSPVTSRRSSVNQDYRRASPEVERRGDSSQVDETWKCSKCGMSNFIGRQTCYKCQFVNVCDMYERNAYPPQAKRPGNSPEECMKRIHVSNLDPTTTAEDLARHFSRWGRVVYSNLVLNKGTKRSKGYGFVSFSVASEAANAIANYHTIRGRAVNVNPLKYSEKIESRLDDLYDEISSDEEDDPGPRDSMPRYLCKVKYCGFKGIFSEFRHHWKEIHTSHGKYLICPVCDTGCPDRTGMRQHLMFSHGVTDDGGALDNILKNVNLEERRNPYFVDPGSVEKEGKKEITHAEDADINPFKVFKCPEKGCPFAASANPLLQHWHTKHLNSSSSLSCPICLVKFIRKGLLIEHFRIGHGIGTASDGGSVSVAGAERISSDEDEDEYSTPSRYMCKVIGCKFRGPKLSFKRHWNDRHELMEKYLACPYCGIGCRDHSEVRYHMITKHKVQDDDPILDDALIRSFIKERINPDYLDPGDVEPEDKFEVPVAKSKPSSSSANKGPFVSANEGFRKRTEASKKDSSSKMSDGNQKAVSKTDKKSIEKKSVMTQTSSAKERTPSTSTSSSSPAFEMMKYNSHNTDSVKKFLAWTDSLMEKLEEAHHEARKKLVALEEAKQQRQQKKGNKEEEQKKDTTTAKTDNRKPVAKKTEAKKTGAKKTEAKKPPPKKSETKTKETAKKKTEPAPIRRVETRGRYPNRWKGRYKK